MSRVDGSYEISVSAGQVYTPLRLLIEKATFDDPERKQTRKTHEERLVHFLV